VAQDKGLSDVTCADSDVLLNKEVGIRRLDDCWEEDVARAHFIWINH
jgi:hypothetical protein